MSTLYHGQIVWRGDLGLPEADESLSKVSPVLSAGGLDSLALAVNPHTECNYAYRHFIRTDDATPVAPGVGANVDKKAVLYFRDPDTLKLLTFTYPTPIAADIDRKETGDIIKDAIVVEIVGYINIVTGKSYIPLYGKYYQIS